MNISNVYQCSIYRIIDRSYLYDDRLPNYLCYVEYKYKFIKKVLVYKDKYNNFIDLETKEIYRVGYDCCRIGDFFINTEKEMIPVSSIIDYKITNMSKRRILKKYRKVEKSDTTSEY